MKINVNCDLCSSNESTLLIQAKDELLCVSDDVFNVVECKVCGHVYLNPRPDADELRQYYPAEYVPYKKRKKSSIIPNILKNDFRELLGYKKNIDSFIFSETCNYLDYGCGSGDHLIGIRERYPTWNLFGYDLSEIAVEQARSQGLTVTHLVEDLNVTFDRIHLGSVIEHLESPNSTLADLSKKLNDNGIIEIKTPNYDSLARKIFGSKWHALDTPRHLHLFKMSTLTQLLSKHGFEIVKTDFKRGATVEVKSLCNVFGIKKKRWMMHFSRIFDPIMYIVGRLGYSSTIIVVARKLEV